MLSVILYGRNDTHGYNLHKRAAISLNAIAELLTDPADEILFVDYNTPDDLPSFPEAIADTLTAKAVAHLKVLRLRPAAHQARFAGRTHLHALEPIARNIAIRRSEPGNRWVLSTNTDMIFCPRQAGQTLTSIVAGLADGYYHLPRFELPEALWETLDRKDGAGLIAAARAWGERFHLNEVVRSAGDHLFDGPGDFQLFLRQDLFAIGGFHEEMILGWHLDANVAARMRRLRGQVLSALDHLVGYHCDHTRQASAYHKGDRVENDPVRFVDQVQTAEVPEQMQSWGMPEAEVEIFGLGQASGARYLDALKAAIPAGRQDFLDAAYAPEGYGRLAYDAGHVLPYLLDLVACAPQGARLAYVGARRDLFEGLVRGWRAMGGTRPVAVPDTAPWLGEAAPSESLALADWIDRADLFVFEVGAEHAETQGELSPEENARLWAVDNAFKAAMARDIERQRQGRPARRAFVVNGVHNVFEARVFRSISASLTPFSTRIRHGYIADRARGRMAAATGPQKAIAVALGALEPMTSAEIERLRALAAPLDPWKADVAAWSAAGKMGAEIAALAAADPELFEADRQTVILDRLADSRPSRRPGLDAPLAVDAGRAPNRLARLEDWDDPAWAAVAGRLYGNIEHASLFNRERWMWERVSLTANLLAEVAPEEASLLLAGALPEAHAFALAELGYAVDIVDPASLAEDRLDAADWRERYAGDGWMTRRPVGLASDRAGAIADGFRYDAVILVENGLFALGRSRAADVLRGAAGLLRPGGHLGFSSLCQVSPSDTRPMEHSLTWPLVRGGAFARALDEHTELELAGEIDERMTPRSFDRLQDAGAPCPAPRLVDYAAPESQTVGVFAFRRREGPARGWAAIGQLLAKGEAASAADAAPAGQAAFTVADIENIPPSAGAPARFGRLTERAVIAKDRVRRTPQGLSVRPEGRRLPVLHLDVGRLDGGGYELTLELFVHQPSATPLAAIALVTDGRIVVERLIDGGAPGPRRVDLYFEIGPSVGAKGLRLALNALAGDFDLLDMTLR